MNKQTSRTHKIARNPVRGFIYGAVWLIIALSIGSVLIHFVTSDSSVFDTSGQRTAGLILTLPFIALAASIFCFVRGALAIAPYRAYLQATTIAERRHLQKEAWRNQGPPVAFMVFFTILSYLGFFTLLTVLIVNYESNGTGGLVAILLMIGLLSAAFTELLIRIIRARS